MKQTLSCEIVRDLLPLWLSAAASRETDEAVRAHLEACPDCAALCARLRELPAAQKDAEEKNLFRKIGRRLEGRYRRAVAGGAAAVVAVTLLHTGLFVVPLRPIAARELDAWAVVHPLREHITNGVPASGDGVVITKGESDDSETVTISLNGGQITADVSQEVIDTCGALSEIHISCPYHIREMRWDIELQQDGKTALVLSKARTTVLGSRAIGTQDWASLEFRTIDRILYRDKSRDAILWER